MWATGTVSLSIITIVIIFVLWCWPGKERRLKPRSSAPAYLAVPWNCLILLVPPRAPWCIWKSRWETAFCALFPLLNDVNPPITLCFLYHFHNTPATRTKVLNWTFELTNGVHLGTWEHFVFALCVVPDTPPQGLRSLNWLLAIVGSYTFLIKHISSNNSHLSLPSSLVCVYGAPAVGPAPCLHWDMQWPP